MRKRKNIMAIIVTKVNYGHYEDIINVGWHTGPNSAGGVDVGIDFKNSDSTKTIKYAVFVVTAYNSVGDEAPCSINGNATRRLKFTGPLAPGQYSGGNYWQTAWYNYSINTVSLKAVEIEYMDGSKETQTTGLAVQPSAAPASGGCYVATAVYGSYDCPQVWTLRRYRDYQLAETWYGRAFIKTYYAISPTLVKWFGATTWFKKMWKGKLDRIVANLQANGVESTPYEDRNW